MAEPIRTLRDDQLGEAVSTPGLARRVAFEEEGHWFGHVEGAPETMSGWHHHGDNLTLGYVLKGQLTLESGPGGRDRVVAREGEYIRVPKRLVHREGNMASSPVEVVLTRVGEGPVVFPVEGPEPA